MNEIIEISSLKFCYGKSTVLDDINIKINRGSFVSIIGPNGSGKTTLLKNISGVLYPCFGSIKLFGKDIKSYRKKELAKYMAYVPQGTIIDFEFSVIDVVLMGRSPYIGIFGTETADDIKIAEKSMQMVNISNLKDKKITEISSGERQRVFIACALTQEPKVILLDEPVSNLDIQHQIQVLSLLKNMCIKENMTVITVLHDINLACEYSDSVIILNHGKLEYMGHPDEVITEDNIKNVYDADIYMIKNPVTGKPHIIPMTMI